MSLADGFAAGRGRADNLPRSGFPVAATTSAMVVKDAVPPGAPEREGVRPGESVGVAARTIWRGNVHGLVLPEAQRTEWSPLVTYASRSSAGRRAEWLGIHSGRARGFLGTHEPCWHAHTVLATSEGGCLTLRLRRTP